MKTLVLSPSLSSLSTGPHRPMMVGPDSSVQEVFDELQDRRSAIVRALTEDVDSFFKDYTSVTEPSNIFVFLFVDEAGPIIIPEEPAFAVHIPRDLPRDKWLSHMAIRCNSWLYSLAFFYSCKCAFNNDHRNELFFLLNGLRTIRQELLEIRILNQPSYFLPYSSISLAVSMDVLIDDILPLFGPGKSADDVYSDLTARRAGIIRALSLENTKFCEACAKAKNETLCLAGNPDGSWQLVESDATYVLQPNIASGILFVNDGIGRQDWLLAFAVHADCWIMALASYLATFSALGRTDRMQLFKLLSDLPSIYEVVAASPAGQCDNILAQKEATVSEELVSEDEDLSGPCVACRKWGNEKDIWVTCEVCGVSLHKECVVEDLIAEMQTFVCPKCAG